MRYPVGTLCMRRALISRGSTEGSRAVRHACLPAAGRVPKLRSETDMHSIHRTLTLFLQFLFLFCFIFVFSSFLVLVPFF